MGFLAIVGACLLAHLITTTLSIVNQIRWTLQWAKALKLLELADPECHSLYFSIPTIFLIIPFIDLKALCLVSVLKHGDWQRRQEVLRKQSHIFPVVSCLHNPHNIMSSTYGAYSHLVKRPCHDSKQAPTMHRWNYLCYQMTWSAWLIRVLLAMQDHRSHW